MNQRQAGNVLKRFAPKGEHPAFINDQEASWLKGMGGSGKRTKSGLKSYASTTPQRGVNEFGRGTEAPEVNIFDNEISQEVQDREHARVRDLQGSPNNNSGGGRSTLSMGGGGGMQTRNNQSTSVSEIDRPTHEFRQNIYDSATDVMDQEYSAYDQERFADASDDTLTAQTGIRSLQGTGQTAYGEAGAVGKDVSGYSAEQVKGGNFLAGQGVDQYMNPHTKNVINANTDQAMKAMQMGRNQLGAQAQMAGAGMGSRSAIEKGVMAGEVMNNLNQQNYNALNQSYADASGQKRQDMAMNQASQQANQQAGLDAQRVRLQGAGAQVSATDAGRGAGYQDASALSQVGADIEGRDQNDKDFAYDQYMEERDWDRNNVSFGSNVLSGAPVETTTTQNNPQYRNKNVDRNGKVISGAAAEITIPFLSTF